MMGLMVEPMLAEQTESVLLRDFTPWMISEQRRVFALCQRFLNDRDEADSATQDVFLKAYQALKKEDAKELDDPARWITRIAVNTCLDRLRSRKWQFWRKRPSSEDEAAILAMTASKAPDAEDYFFAGEIGARLNSAMDRLSERQRAVFLLRHHQDLSLEEIGNMLKLDVGTVKAHMFRAVSKLRAELRDLYEAREKHGEKREKQ
jgi:RNA polymerase sigma-70 factor (ECF subfamily)